MSEPRNLRLTLAQLNATVGDIGGNLNKMIETWKFYDQTSDLVVFPELFLCGYPPEDLAHNALFLSELDDAIDKLVELSRELQSSILIPTVMRDPNGRYKNTFVIYQNGEKILFQEKAMLPNYGVFDEQRIFAPADYMPRIQEFNGIKVGFLICEDLWFEHMYTHLKNEGAEFLIVINGSPYDFRKIAQRTDVALQCCEQTGLSVAYLNLIGGQDDLVFDGNSFIMHGKTKQKVCYGPRFYEGVMQATITFDADICLIDANTLADHSKAFIYADDDYCAILLGLRDYVRKNGFQKVLLGLSGGIDSALVACMAVDALGPENVRCVMLPSEFTSPESLADAEECAKNLGVQYDIIPIKDAIQTFEKIIPDLKGLAHENAQSRIRGLVLMALSNISGELLLSTGNKSELATGYATLYGDMNGAFNPIKDLYKTQVYEMARNLNNYRDKWGGEAKAYIPQNIIDKVPSAELRHDQKDQDSLPPYDVLDNILFCLVDADHIYWPGVEGDLTSYRELDEHHPEDVKKAAKLLRASEFKRRQSCPGPKISPRAFGKDRRYPITNKFLNRIEKP
jgi:NAD+ synthase